MVPVTLSAAVFIFCINLIQFFSIHHIFQIKLGLFDIISIIVDTTKGIFPVASLDILADKTQYLSPCPSMCIVGPILAAIQFTDSSAKVSTTVATVDQLLAGEEQEHSDIPVTFATHNIEFFDVNYSYHEGVPQ